MKSLKISILGCGQMASALSIGIHTKFPNFKFFGFNPTFEKASSLMGKINGLAKEKISDLPPSDIYLLGAKPQNLGDLAEMLSPHIPKNSLIISIMAGISSDLLSKKLNSSKIVRVMPNTPCKIGEGVCSIFFCEQINLEDRTQIKEIFLSVGKVFEQSTEEHFDISTVFAGSGPGFIFEIAHIMHQKITEMGIESERAKEMINQTFLGSSKLMAQSKSSYEELRKSVTSKNGMTEAGLNILYKKDFSKILKSAFEESLNRCFELGKLYD